MAAVLVLDFDGTVLDTEWPVYRSWADVYEAHGQALDLGFWQSIIGTADTFDPWADLEHRVGRPLPAVVAAERRARRDELLEVAVPRPGVLAWLEEAERLAVPVGIASSSPPDWVERHLRRLGLLARFECLVADALDQARRRATS